MASSRPQPEDLNTLFEIMISTECSVEETLTTFIEFIPLIQVKVRDFALWFKIPLIILPKLRTVILKVVMSELKGPDLDNSLKR